MQYLLMIYSNEAEYAKMDPAAGKKMSDEFEVFTKDIIQSGNFKAGDRLRPSSTATTVRVKDGKVLTTDGPFAETREQLGGYYLIEAKDLDAALGIAARIPSARHGYGALVGLRKIATNLRDLAGGTEEAEPVHHLADDNTAAPDSTPLGHRPSIPRDAP